MVENPNVSPKYIYKFISKKNISCTCEEDITLDDRNPSETIDIDHNDEFSVVTFRCKNCSTIIQGNFKRRENIINGQIDFGQKETIEVGDKEIERSESFYSGNYLVDMEKRNDSIGMEIRQEMSNLQIDIGSLRYHIENLENIIISNNLFLSKRLGAKTKIAIHAELKSIVEAIYSFKHTYSSICSSPYISVSEDVSNKYDKWNNKQYLKAMEGLRHYTVHDRNVDYSISSELESVEFQLKGLVEVLPDLSGQIFDSIEADVEVSTDDVWTLESDADENNKQGYNKSPEEHYGDLECIPVIEFGRKNLENMKNITEQLADSIEDDDFLYQELKKLEDIEQSIISNYDI